MPPLLPSPYRAGRLERLVFLTLPALCLALLTALVLTAVPAMAQDAADADAPAAVDPAVEASAADEVDAEAAFRAALEEAGVTPGQYRVNNLWILISAALVFVMHLGFCSVESGLCRQKNAVNILTKNVWIVCVGILTYWAWGFVSMYPGEVGAEGATWIWGGVFAYGKPLDPTDPAGFLPTYASGGYSIYSDFIFQAMFAATAATIVSGAVAERIKLAPFMVFAIVIVGFGYPFVGSWKWGGGWLDGIGFYDFAGSSIVHAFGGWAALAGVLLLGPRIGKYGPNGEVRAIPGHNIPLANIGVFLLFLGWFGFNGGSVLSAAESRETMGRGVDFVFVTTALSGVAGGAVALLTSWIVIGKPDLTMGLNGMLAGLVGITAGADVISPGFSIVVGAIAGVIVVLAVLGFDRIRIDDPVGAISVHGVCGIWGTLAVGIFGDAALLVNDDGERIGTFADQLIGTFATGVTAFLISLVIFGILKVAGGIRVSEAEEIDGLDHGEHGMNAYNGFAVETIGTVGASTTRSY